MEKPTVHVYVLGGTITMRASKNGIVPKMDGEQLVSQIPGLAQVATLDVHTPFLKPSASQTFDDICLLAAQLGKHPLTPSVVVQGTDTIDETAFLLSLFYQGSAPVVVTGAMRGANAASADGPANVLAAVLTATSEPAQNTGVLVVLNDTIHHACRVEKMHKSLLSAFASPNGGPLGYIVEGRARFCSRLETARLYPIPTRMGKVAIIKAGLDMPEDLLTALPGMGYEGVVIEATGAGHVSEKWVRPLTDLVQKMPVVLASRVIGGTVFRQTYGFPGSETDLLKHGVLTAGWLSPHKARLVLAAALGAGYSQEETSRLLACFDA